MACPILSVRAFRTFCRVKSDVFLAQFKIVALLRSSPEMTRYKQAEFQNVDSSNIGYAALNSESIGTSVTHIRFTGTTMWKARSILERCLLIICTVLLLTIIMFTIVISSNNDCDDAQILHVTSHGEGEKLITSGLLILSIISG
ncbi:Neprilysin-3 [Formica fusca]